MVPERRLIWIDLEMTGLDPFADTILEIATIITDDQLNIIARGPALVIHHDELILSNMNDWCKTTHEKSGLCSAVKSSTISMAEAEQETISFIMQHCQQNTGVLAGNSVWQDKFFLLRYMPRLIAYLNYRLIDVSTVKELVARWYPSNPQIKFKKPDNHRALEDIEYSIEELRHYRNYFFKEM